MMIVKEITIQIRRLILGLTSAAFSFSHLHSNTYAHLTMCTVSYCKRQKHLKDIINIMIEWRKYHCVKTAASIVCNIANNLIDMGINIHSTRPIDRHSFAWPSSPYLLRSLLVKNNAFWRLVDVLNLRSACREFARRFERCVRWRRFVV